MSRVHNAARNVAYGYAGTFLTMLLGFVSRTIFIQTIGITYLGVNGLYSNVLSVLSLAELGIGSAMNYSLYKPAAVGDREQLKSLMALYRRAYRWIAAIVAGLGLALLPFLGIIIKDPGAISSRQLTLFYLIFLFNTVTSYFVAYKFSLVVAEQKNYIQTRVNTITTLVVTLAQIIVLLVFRSFLFYLLSASVLQLAQKILVNAWFNRLYPWLRDRTVRPLSAAEQAPIKKNIKALIYHKIGSISVHQTDNILISTFINVTTVGLIANYTLITTTVNKLFYIIFNTTLSGIGNLIATEPVERQYFLFRVYRLMGFWLFGFAATAFLILISPFIQLWLGPERTIAAVVVWLIVADYYAQGHRLVVNNFKIAAGVFDDDKYVAIAQAVVNLVVSIVMVRLIGLPGIYIGTLAQGLVCVLSRPVIVFRKVFHRKAADYYRESAVYLAVLALPAALLLLGRTWLLADVTVARFAVMGLLVLLLPNGFFWLVFRKRPEYRYLQDLVLNRLLKRKQ